MSTVQFSRSSIFINVEFPLVLTPFLTLNGVVQFIISKDEDELDSSYDIVDYENVFYMNKKVDSVDMEKVKTSLKAMDMDLYEMANPAILEAAEKLTIPELLSMHFQEFGIIQAVVIQSKKI